MCSSYPCPDPRVEVDIAILEYGELVDKQRNVDQHPGTLEVIIENSMVYYCTNSRLSALSVLPVALAAVL